MDVRTTMDERDQPAAASQPLSVSITAAHELADARARLRDWLRASIPVGQADEILLASGEALSNALEHGRTPITLRLEWVDNTLHLTVRDSGKWRVSADPPARGRTRGLGIPIMTALTDSLTFETTDGTTVTLSRRFAS
jgi:anti-sigma regulatory factor (Ser/Thr protein kinase)